MARIEKINLIPHQQELIDSKHFETALIGGYR